MTTAEQRINIALTTLATIVAESYTKDSKTHNLPGGEYYRQNTFLYGPDAPSLTNWGTHLLVPSDHQAPSPQPTQLEIIERTTVQAIQMLGAGSPPLRIGVLNFANATEPGGGFLRGAQPQEESLARTMTLYQSLVTPAAAPFYKIYNANDKSGFYSNAMIYTPDVILFRDDTGAFFGPPIQVSVVTSAAVNAGVVRGSEKAGDIEAKIEATMRDRMGRILRVFEERGDKILVLGSFGTGVFKNDIKMVASIWADLLARPGARFARVFERVVFAIYDNDTFVKFKNTFEARAKET